MTKANQKLNHFNMDEALRMFCFAFVLALVVSCVTAQETTTLEYEGKFSNKDQIFWYLEKSIFVLFSFVTCFEICLVLLRLSICGFKNATRFHCLFSFCIYNEFFHA